MRSDQLFIICTQDNTGVSLDVVDKNHEPVLTNKWDFSEVEYALKCIDEDRTIVNASEYEYWVNPNLGKRIHVYDKTLDDAIDDGDDDLSLARTIDAITEVIAISMSYHGITFEYAYDYIKNSTDFAEFLAQFDYIELRDVDARWVGMEVHVSVGDSDVYVL